MSRKLEKNFKEEYNKLNPEQKEAVNSIEEYQTSIKLVSEAEEV